MKFIEKSQKQGCLCILFQSKKRLREALPPTKGLAILGLDGVNINFCNAIFLSSRARQNAVQLL